MSNPFARLVAWWKHITRDRPAILIAAHNHEEGLRADTERLARRLDLYGPDWGGKWPQDLCAYPPCEWEANYRCPQHPAGKHHRRQSQGEHVVIASVTDLAEKRGRVH